MNWIPGSLLQGGGNVRREDVPNPGRQPYEEIGHRDDDSPVAGDQLCTEHHNRRANEDLEVLFHQ